MATLYKSGIVITGDATSGVRVLRLTQTELQKLQGQMNATQAANARMNAVAASSRAAFSSVIGQLRVLTPMLGAYGAALAGREVINATLAMDGYQRSLLAVTGTTQAASRELAFIRSEADRVGVSFQGVVAEFSKLAAAAKGTALEGQGVRDVFSSVIEISRVLNLSVADTNGAIFALQQMLSKGKISAEELRRQLGERIPGAVGAMARAVGVSIAELDGMLQRGELLSAEVLPKFSDELRKMAAAGLEAAKASPAAEFNRLGNALFDLNVAAGTEVMPLLADGAVQLRKAIEALTPHVDTLLKLLMGFTAARFVGPALSALGAQALAAARGMQGLSAAFLFSYYRADALRGVLGLLKGGLRLLGGPVGLAITAASAIWALSDSEEGLSENTEEANRHLLDQIEHLQYLSRTEMERFLEGAEERIDELITKNEELVVAMEDVRRTRALAEANPEIQIITGAPAELTAQLSGLKSEIDANKLLIEELTNALAEAGVVMSRWGGSAEVSAREAGKFSESVHDLIKALDKKRTTLDSTRDALIEQAYELLENTALNEADREALLGSVQALERKIKAQKDAKKTADALTRAEEAGLKTLEKAFALYDPVGQAAQDYQEEVKQLLFIQTQLQFSDETLIELMEALRKSYPELTTEAEKLAQAKKELNDESREELQTLEDENAALRLAIANNEDLVIAKMRVAGIDESLIALHKEQIAQNKVLLEQYEQQQQGFEDWRTVLERGLERLDDAFAGFWEDMLKGGKFSFDSLKDIALSTLAEIIHHYTTRRIVLAVGGMFGTSSTASAAGFSGLSSMFGGSGSGGSISSWLSGIGTAFTGNSFGTALAGLPSWLGGAQLGAFGPNYGIAQGGLFAKAGNIGNLGYLGYGLGGSFLGNLIAPNTWAGIGGGLGATFGAAIGAGSSTLAGMAGGAWAGPIGAAIGAAIGIALGSFKKDRPPVLEASGFDVSGESASDHDEFIKTALGGLFLRTRRLKDPDLEPFREAFTDFDAAIASFLTKSQLDTVSEALERWNIQLEGANLSLEKLLQSRFDVILGTFGADIQEFARGAGDFTEQVNRLQMAVTASNIINELPALFGDRTWKDFIVVAQAMKGENEELVETFGRLVEAVQLTTQAVTTLTGYAGSNLGDDYAKLVASQQRTTWMNVLDSADAIREAAAAFDQTAESAVSLSVMVAARYQLELEMLAQIDQAITAINSTFGELIEQIQVDLRGPAENYEYFAKQAEDLAAILPTLVDPAMIMQTLAEIERLTGRAYGFLGDEQKAAMGPEIIAFLEGVRDIGIQQMEQSRQMLLDGSQALRDDVGVVLDSMEDVLALVANSYGITASELSSAAADLSRSAADLTGAAANLGRGAAGAGAGGVGPGGLPIPTPNIPGVSGSAQNAAGGSAITVTVNADSLQQAATTTAVMAQETIRQVAESNAATVREISRLLNLGERGGSYV